MYTTLGRTPTDCCFHLHDDFDEAQECLMAHQAQMREKGRPSARTVVEIDSFEEIEEAY